MAKQVEPRADSRAPIPFVGRREELGALAAALRRRESRLILGPAGAGKTRLIQEAIPLAGQPSVLLQRPAVLHALLVEVAARLGCQLDRFPSLQRATSMALKPAIIESLRHSPRCVVIEDVSDADPRMYRFLQEIYYLPRTCLIVTSTSRDKLGFLRKLLWDPREEISLGPLGEREAEELFDAAARQFGLQELNLPDFRAQTLAAVRGNAGQIMAMCRMATRPDYRYGSHIKFAPLWIDVLSEQAQ